MNEDAYEITRDDDDNARDEFSAASYFKSQTKTQNAFFAADLRKNKPNTLGDITNFCNTAKNVLTAKPIVVTGTQATNYSKSFPKFESGNYFRRVFDENERPSSTNTNSEFGIRKRRKAENKIRCDDHDHRYDTEKIEDDSVDSMQSFPVAKRQKPLTEPVPEQTGESMFMDFFDVDENVIRYHVSQALTDPANGYNSFYRKYIVVPEPSLKAQLVKIVEKSRLWMTMIGSCKIEKRILLTSPRKWCSPPEQFVVTKNNQYKSQCLIQTYYSLDEEASGAFLNVLALDGTNRFARRFNHINSLGVNNVNTCHFHELFVERLRCNEMYDFMPKSTALTGCILGGFVNDFFELSRIRFISTEIIHIAVDYVYQYLSRANDVPLNDLRWISLGAIWVAGKYEGTNMWPMITSYAKCTQHHLRKAELRLLSVIDFNVTKPHAINFRNRYLMIEQFTSSILHLSSFILDMTLHCYTLMLLPASKRAAAAMWLARLIDTFENVRFNEDMWSNMSAAREKMSSVWPETFEKLTGYSHFEISLLGLKMHVIIIAFISGGEPKYPSVSACHDKYSSHQFGELTRSYEKFTARTIFFASELYCRLYNLELSTWMEKNEFQTLWRNYCDNKVPLRHTQSVPVPMPKSSNSCPELIPKPVIAPEPVDVSIIPATTKDFQLQKFDSGYSTSSNMENLCP